MAWVTPTNVATGDVLTASKWNQDVVANAEAIGGAWTSFTPSWTNVTLTGATNEGAYIAAGKLYIVRIKLTWGAGTAFTGAPTLTLPNSASLKAAYGTSFQLGTVLMVDSSAGAFYYGGVHAPSSGATTVRFLSFNASGTYLIAGSWDATNPTTWASGDRMEAQFMFEAA